MIANVSAHRRANAFAQALEDSGPGTPGQAAEQSEPPYEPQSEPPGQTGQSGESGRPERSARANDQRTEAARMLTLANGLTAVPRATLDPEVKVVQRAQLVAAMEAMLREGAGGGATDPSVPEQRTRKGTKGAHRAGPLRKLRPRTRLSKGLAAGGLTISVAAGALGGVAAASGDALPGDTLYGLKRGMEDVKRGLADSDTDRGELYLDQASTRLHEARRLMDRGRGGHLDHESVTEVRRTLNGMRHDAAEGHRLLLAAYERDGSLGPIQALSAFSRSHRDSWSTLRETLPVQLGDVSEQVSSVFDALEQEVEPLRSLLPRPPAPSGTPGGQGPTADRTPTGPPPGGAERTAPARPSGGESGDTRERGTGGTGDRPAPSASSPGKDGKSGADGKDGALIGGGTGGLLDPPQGRDPGNPTASDKPSADPEPDVTLPPLLPGLLPDLGIDAKDTRP
ncbi:DUF5667 domain-containing protein [Streptomyces sp. NPDC005955]|uniref:DUF5667 domain-containing protein n=1 Tax=Streptomyces sp. NPDC005955 TaxID=3364738 RepID=UPI003682D91F